MLCKLRVVKLGKSSVTYQVGIFEVSVDSASKSTQGKKAAVVTQSTHVFVDRVSRRPVKVLPDSIRNGLEKLKIEEFVLKEGNSKL
jgi:acyl-CoA thioester hydrolase